MKSFEKTLKTLLNSNDEILLIKNFNVSDNDLNFLIAKGLIKIMPYYNNDLKITLTNEGVLYFYEKSQHRKDVAINWSFNFLMAVLSASCGSALTLLIQYVFKQI